MPEAAATATGIACPVCERESMALFFELKDVPVFCNVLHETREEALAAARADLRLAHCAECDLIYNAAFDAERVAYNEQYENALHYSPYFIEYADGLQHELAQRFQLTGKQVIEIGCGDGEFLQALCRDAGANGVGFDPSYPGPDQCGNVRFIRDYYSSEHAHLKADFVFARHVLEHIADPIGFLRSLRSSIGTERQAAVYFEVPNALYTFRDMGIWDLIYEHCNYFTETSLSHVFDKAGFSVQRVETAYSGQFLHLDALSHGETRAGDCNGIASEVQAFAQRYRAKCRSWNQYVGDLLEAGRYIAVWGTGSKGVTFLNTIARGADVRSVIDINPRKQGKYVAGTGHRIAAPESLPIDRPITVLVMNPLYREEIERQLTALGVDAELETV